MRTVLDEGFADGADAQLEIRRAAECRSARRPSSRNRVTGEVAARQVLLQRHVRRGEHDETFVPRSVLRSVRERIFLWV